jgi:hypothetical protein
MQSWRRKDKVREGPNVERGQGTSCRVYECMEKDPSELIF